MHKPLVTGQSVRARLNSYTVTGTVLDVIPAGSFFKTVDAVLIEVEVEGVKTEFTFASHEVTVKS